MAKKLLLNRQRTIPTGQVPSAGREASESEVASSLRNSSVSGKTEHVPFFILTRLLNVF